MHFSLMKTVSLVLPILAAPVAVLADEIPTSTISQALECTNAGAGVATLRAHFEEFGWPETSDTASEVMHAVIFLGNVDAADPSSWRTTYAWAAELANIEGDVETHVFSQAGVSVLISPNQNGNRACVLIANAPLMDMLLGLFPDARVAENSSRRFALFYGPRLRFSAAEFPITNQNPDLRLIDGAQFSATFVVLDAPI
jgi:hypothetical protein